MFLAIKKAENKFIEANKSQLSKGENIYSDIVGRYKKRTQEYADADGINKSKQEGDPYNFDWFGNFFDGFKLSVSNDEVTILSNVQGTTEKLNFLNTNNLYGLNDENLKIRIQEDILPFIHKFVRVTLNI